MKYVAIIDSDDELLEETIKDLKETLFLGDENAMYCFELTSIKQAPEDIFVKTVTLTPFEIKMMQMSLYHQWFRMTDDNGKAVNCEQKSADCVFDLMNRFEKLRAEVEEENKL